MGTSAAIRGPRGGGWATARGAGTRWAKAVAEDPETDPDQFAQACLAALAAALRADADAFGLRAALHATMARLVDALDELWTDGTATFRVAGHALGVEEPADAVYVGFVDRVAGADGTVVDATVRRAVARAADRLVTEPSIARALDSGSDVPRVGGELFCEVYRTFLGDAVSEFLQTMIVTSVYTAVPAMAALPPGAGDAVLGWIAGKVVSVVPDPCAAAAATEPHQLGRRLPDIALNLMDSAITAALDPADGLEVAA